MKALFYLPSGLAGKLMPSPERIFWLEMKPVPKLTSGMIRQLVSLDGTVFFIKPSRAIRIATNCPQLIMLLEACGATLDRFVDDPKQGTDHSPVSTKKKPPGKKVRIDRKRRPSPRRRLKKQPPYCRTAGKAIVWDTEDD